MSNNHLLLTTDLTNFIFYSRLTMFKKGEVVGQKEGKGGEDRET